MALVVDPPGNILANAAIIRARKRSAKIAKARIYLGRKVSTVRASKRSKLRRLRILQPNRRAL